LGTEIKYILDTGEIVAGSNKLMFDLFNAVGSGHKLYIRAIYVRVKADVAVSGVVAPRFDFFLTSTVGTSGTSVPYAPSAAGSALIPLDSKQSGLPTGVTARTIPTGGATSAVWLTATHPFSEETNASTYLAQYNNVLGEASPIVVNPGEGIKATQGSVASVNSYSFVVVFGVEEE
jgi:hypothetical protein